MFSCVGEVNIVGGLMMNPSDSADQQGCIELPKTAKGHAMYIDGKLQSVTKHSFQMYFWYVHCVMLMPLLLE